MDATWHRPATVKAHSPRRLLRIAAALVLASILAPAVINVAAAPSDPIVTENIFNDAPRKLSYFADSPVSIKRS